MKTENTYKLQNFNQLLEAVEMGLDVEFFIGETRYNISWRKGKPYICICPDGDAVFFDNANELFSKYKVNGSPIKNIWKEIDIYSM